MDRPKLLQRSRRIQPRFVFLMSLCSDVSLKSLSATHINRTDCIVSYTAIKLKGISECRHTLFLHRYTTSRISITYLAWFNLVVSCVRTQCPNRSGITRVLLTKVFNPTVNSTRSLSIHLGPFMIMSRSILIAVHRCFILLSVGMLLA